MSLPAVAVRAATPAARAAATRISAWISTAPISKLNAIKDFMKHHPTLSAVVGSLGLDEIVDRAMSGDDNSIQALNDAAAHVGLSGGAASGSESAGLLGRAQQESTGLLDRAQQAIGSMFNDSQTEAITDAEADRTQHMRGLASFIRGEVSSNPEFVLRYHAMMNEFLSMDIESVENLVRAY